MTWSGMSLTAKILIAMAAGLLVGLGLFFSGLSEVDGLRSIFEVGGKIFLASLKLLVVPIVLVSLVCGVTSLGEDSSRMGSIVGKTMGLYLLTTAIAITLALLASSIVRPGEGVNLETDADFVAKEAPPLSEVIVKIFPTNPVKAMADGNMLQVIVFAVLFGLAINQAGDHGLKVREMFMNLNEVVMKMVNILMKLAPLGVFCLMASLFAEIGLEVFGSLVGYFLTVVGVLLLHGFVTYGGMLTLLGRVNPVQFFWKMRPVQLFAFSTASSNATIPVTLNLVKKRLGVENRVAGFTVPLGATINMDGTAIMQGVATGFIAQAYGIDLSLSDYATVVVTATLASIGTAGVPGVGLVMLSMVLQQVGLPVEGIGLIIGVDRLLDMLRTAVNVTGDGAVTCLVARSEDAFREETYREKVLR